MNDHSLSFERITREKILNAFLQSKAIPVRSCYITRADDGKFCACGLGAIFLSDYCSTEVMDQVEQLIDSDEAITDIVSEALFHVYPTEYNCGFVDGFDGCPRNFLEEHWDPKLYWMGIGDGENAWKAVQPFINSKEGSPSA